MISKMHLDKRKKMIDTRKLQTISHLERKTHQFERQNQRQMKN